MTAPLRLGWRCLVKELCELCDAIEAALLAFDAAERTQPSPASSAQLEAAKDVIAFIGPGLLVLRNMLHVAKLPLGEEKAKEMIKAVQDFLAADFPTPAPPSNETSDLDQLDEIDRITASPASQTRSASA